MSQNPKLIPSYGVQEEEDPDSVSVNKARSVHHRLLQPWATFSSDHVRCFCNYPQCVTSGYMCKSRKGGCFSTLLKDPRHHPKHGCLELLTEGELETGCHNRRRDVDASSGKTFCCYQNMCNHIDSPQTKTLINNFNISALLGDLPQNGHRWHNDSVQEPMYYTESQVWFRAATIAVPICGAMILFLLIFLAMKILRSENYRSSNRKLERGNSIYGHYTLSRLKSEQSEVLNHYREVANHIPNCNKCVNEEANNDHRSTLQVPLVFKTGERKESRETKPQNNLARNYPIQGYDFPYV